MVCVVRYSFLLICICLRSTSWADTIMKGMNVYMNLAFHFSIRNFTFMDYISTLDPVVENVVVCIH